MFIVATAVVLAAATFGDRCAAGRTCQTASGLEQIGSAVVRDPLNRGTWVADEERDEIAFVDRENRVTATAACAWPERIVVAADGRAFANCRASGTVAVLGLDGFGAELPVGFEPRGLALDAEAGTLYVGVSSPSSIVEVDTRSLRVGRRTPSSIAPDHLALGPSGLVVLARRGAELGLLDVDATAPSLSSRPLNANMLDIILGGLGLHGIGGDFQRKGRGATEPKNDAWNGMALVRTEAGVGVLFARMNTGGDAPVQTGTYGGGGFRPPFSLHFAELGSDTQYSSRELGGFADVSGAQVSEGVLFFTARNRPQLATLELRSRLVSGNAFAGALTTRVIPNAQAGLGAVGLSVDATGAMSTFDSIGRILVTFSMTREGSGVGEVALAEGKLSALARRGQELFHSSSSTLTQTGLSCAGCHPDGREDGLVWSIDGDSRQTPLLAGRIADTAPYGWHGENPLLESNLEQTIKRLGGGGLTSDELSALGEYVRTGLRAPPVAKVADPPALVAHGKKVFESEAECGSCHDGSATTDGESYALGYGRLPKAKKAAFNTPSLRFVSLSAPYLHDGSAKTLEELLADPHDRMGKTGKLTAEQRRALAAYLRTL